MRDRNQQRVARRVAAGIVDFLEVIEVDSENREASGIVVRRAVDRQRAHQRIQTLAESATVLQLGQTVLPREQAGAGLGLPFGGDVFVRRHPTAAWQRRQRNAENAAVRQIAFESCLRPGLDRGPVVSQQVRRIERSGVLAVG